MIFKPDAVLLVSMVLCSSTIYAVTSNRPFTRVNEDKLVVQDQDVLNSNETIKPGKTQDRHGHAGKQRTGKLFRDKEKVMPKHNTVFTDGDNVYYRLAREIDDVGGHDTNVAEENADDFKNGGCRVSIDHRSINYFRSRLQIDDPNFVRFRIVFGNETRSVTFTNQTFFAFNWVWTYNTSNGIYPYIHWNVDFGILSFKLLDVKTLDRDPYIAFNVSNCNLTLGTPETTELLAEQFKVLVSELGENKTIITKYQESYFCFMAEAPGFRDTFGYLMGQYFLYPISAINYNCCFTSFNYSATRYEYACLDKQMDKWVQCTIGPYILGVILFLYFPYVLLKAAGHKKKQELCDREHDERTPLLRDTDKTLPTELDDGKWIYLDGKFPKTFTGLFASLLPSRFPVALSRFKRFLFVLLGPSMIYIQIWIYSKQSDTMRKMTEGIFARGVPVGFLALMAKYSNETALGFVPAFGGARVLLINYYVLGIIFLVLPRSVEDVVENGIPRLKSNLTPLNLSAREIRELSKVHASDKSGHGSATDLILCSFYMLFTGVFWKKVVSVQITRIQNSFWFQNRVCKCMFMLMLPLYVTVCLAEIVICIFYYFIPLWSFVVVIIRGAVRTSAIFINNIIHASGRSVWSVLLRNRLVIAVFSLIVALMFIFYVYSFCLVFIQSFFFLSQILVYCYVAVLVYPAVSFGYIFFGVVLLYYIFRLIRSFGVKYLELLNDIIENMRLIEERDNYTAVANDILIIRNIRLNTRFRGIKINDAMIPMAQNVLQSLNQNHVEREGSRLNYKNNAYGIRKDLFDYVVRRHLPVHQQVLKIAFHLAMICLCLLITMSLTAGFITGPTSEMSEVMHVIFIITVGALPRVLEVAMHDSSEHIQRDIKLRSLEDTINQYWLEEAAKDDKDTESFCHVQVENELPVLPP